MSEPYTEFHTVYWVVPWVWVDSVTRMPGQRCVLMRDCLSMLQVREVYCTQWGGNRPPETEAQRRNSTHLVHDLGPFAIVTFTCYKEDHEAMLKYGQPNYSTYAFETLDELVAYYRGRFKPVLAEVKERWGTIRPNRILQDIRSQLEGSVSLGSLHNKAKATALSEIMGLVSADESHAPHLFLTGEKIGRLPTLDETVLNRVHNRADAEALSVDDLDLLLEAAVCFLVARDFR